MLLFSLVGQTPLNLAKALEARGVKILGTSQDSIDTAEDRDRFQQLISDLDLKQPDNGIVHSLDDAHSDCESYWVTQYWFVHRMYWVARQ